MEVIRCISCGDIFYLERGWGEPTKTIKLLIEKQANIRGIELIDRVCNQCEVKMQVLNLTEISKPLIKED